MKTLTAIIVSGIFALSATACTCNSGLFGGKTVKASRNYVTKNIKVDNFTGLNLAGSPNVTYTQKAGKPEVEVYTSDNIVDLLDINVVNNTLNIKFKKGVNVSYNKLEIRVSSETLNNISVAGSGNVELANGLKTDHLKVSVAGSGDIDADNITCTGNLNVSVAGSGDIEGSNITCANLTASIAGSGDLKLDNVSAAGTEGNIDGNFPGSRLPCSGFGRPVCIRSAGKTRFGKRIRFGRHQMPRHRLPESTYQRQRKHRL